MASLSTGSLARIEDILETLVTDIRNRRKEPTVLSDNGHDGELVRSEVVRELVGEGITRHDVQTHKRAIKAFLRDLVRDTQVRNSTTTESFGSSTLSGTPSSRSWTSLSLDHVPPPSRSQRRRDESRWRTHLPYGFMSGWCLYLACLL